MTMTRMTLTIQISTRLDDRKTNQQREQSRFHGPRDIVEMAAKITF